MAARKSQGRMPLAPQPVSQPGSHVPGAVPDDLAYLRRQRGGARALSDNHLGRFGPHVENAVRLALVADAMFTIRDALTLLSGVVLPPDDLALVQHVLGEEPPPAFRMLDELAEASAAFVEATRPLVAQAVSLRDQLERMNGFLDEHPVFAESRKSLTLRQVVALNVALVEYYWPERRIEPRELAELVNAIRRVLGGNANLVPRMTASAWREVLWAIRPAAESSSDASGEETKKVEPADGSPINDRKVNRGALLSDILFAANRPQRQRSRESGRPGGTSGKPTRSR